MPQLGVRESGQKPELTRSGRDAGTATMPLDQRSGKAARPDTSEPEDLSTTRRHEAGGSDNRGLATWPPAKELYLWHVPPFWVSRGLDPTVS
jgi:hypothetical protein